MPEALDLLRRINEAQRIGQTEGADMMRGYLEYYDHAHGYKSDLSTRPLEAKGKQRNPRYLEAAEKLRAMRGLSR